MWHSGWGSCRAEVHPKWAALSQEEGRGPEAGTAAGAVHTACTACPAPVKMELGPQLMTRFKAIRLASPWSGSRGQPGLRGDRDGTGTRCFGGFGLQLPCPPTPSRGWTPYLPRSTPSLRPC